LINQLRKRLIERAAGAERWSPGSTRRRLRTATCHRPFFASAASFGARTLVALA